MRIKFYAPITTFQKEKSVSLSALSELSFAGGWPGQSSFHWGTISMAMKGAPSTLDVCVWRGGGTGPSKVGTLLISASVFTVWDTSESAEGMTLFSEGSGTGHHGGGHHSYIVGVWGHLVRGMGLLVLFRYRVNQIQVIYWTQGEAGAVSESLGKRWDRGTTIAGRGTWYK